jgi:predicted amidophosphoribosyltransferase
MYHSDAGCSYVLNQEGPEEDIPPEPFHCAICDEVMQGRTGICYFCKQQIYEEAHCRACDVELKSDETEFCDTCFKQLEKDYDEMLEEQYHNFYLSQGLSFL